MLKAVKGNKVYEIDEKQKKRYLEEGFDIYENGRLKEYSPKKEVKYADYKLLQDELIKVKDEIKSNAELIKSNEELVKQNAELVKSNEELVKQNAELVKSNEKAKGKGAKEE